MRIITHDQFREELMAQGVSSHEHAAFRCIRCKTIQSAKSLILAGAGADFDAVERWVGFSCVGRWTAAGPHKKDGKPGAGCDWTLGGLFRIHELEVIYDGKNFARFEIATAEEALQLERENLVRLARRGVA